MKHYEREVRARQVDLINQHIYTILAGNLVVGLAIILVFWNQVEADLLAGWSLAMFAIILFRTMTAYRYRADTRRMERSDKWGGLFALGAGLAGISWAFASILFFFPEKPELVLFIACMYAGLVSGATASTSAYLPAFYAFIIPATIPFTLRNLLEGGMVFMPIGITICVYIVVSVIFARTQNKSVAELYRLQFENRDLLNDLEQQKMAADNSRDLAEKAVHDKSQFLAAASHDLRQPLHASGLLLGVLRDHITGKEGKALLDKVLKSTEALHHLFNSLLDVSRLDAGVVEAHLQHINLSMLTASIEIEYRLQAEEKHLLFDIQCGPSVVYADPVLLERILGNLISNAITYTDGGSVSIQCQQPSKDFIQITVTDTGIGIPETEANLVFSEYYQINNPERDRSKGLGLGLAIVKRLCTLMDIRIELHSVVGRRTTFTLTVPSGDPAQVSQERTLPEIINLAGLVVLVIDDDRDVLEGMRKLLSSWGCETLIADSAEMAIKAISSIDRPPEIVFADYRLRENRTGVDAVYAVFEELNMNIPAVIITGDTSADRLREAKDSGFRLLHKPVTPVELRVTLQQEVRMFLN